MQSILDVFLHAGAEKPLVEEPRTEGQAEAGDVAPCCGRQLYRLHVGALYLYRKGGDWRAVADMSHVYRKCREGLVKNIRALKRIFGHVSEQAEIFGVGKAFDDILYIYMLGEEVEITLPAEFQGLKATVFTYGEGLEKAISDFERFNCEEHVDNDIVEEALGIGFQPST